MRELHGDRWRGQVMQVVTAEPRGQQHERGSEPLASGRHERGHRPRHDGRIALDLAAQQVLDHGQVARDRPEEGGYLVCAFCSSQIRTSSASTASPNMFDATEWKCSGIAVTSTSWCGSAPSARSREWSSIRSTLAAV